MTAEGLSLPEGLADLGPDATKDVIALASKVIDIQAERDAAELALARRGQTQSFMLCIFFGLLALTVTLTGHDAVGGTIAGTTIVSVATAFIVGRTRTRA